jgi:hypothetical protein
MAFLLPHVLCRHIPPASHALHPPIPEHPQACVRQAPVHAQPRPPLSRPSPSEANNCGQGDIARLPNGAGACTTSAFVLFNHALCLNSTALSSAFAPQGAHNCVACPLCALSCRLEHRCARSDPHDGRMPCRFSSQNGFLGPNNRPSRGEGLNIGKSLSAWRLKKQSFLNSLEARVHEKRLCR